MNHVFWIRFIYLQRVVNSHHTSSSLSRTIWLHPKDPKVVQIIDQRVLPHQLAVTDLRSHHDAVRAIKEMWVRGAPLIGATAAFGCYLGALEAPEKGLHQYMKTVSSDLQKTRPTAVNLSWALDRVRKAVADLQTKSDLIKMTMAVAQDIVEEDVKICRDIGLHGLSLIETIHHSNERRPVQILTHCNAGRMATIEWGTATSPIYHAHERGIPLHIWVDETRPRNQGARITAWELGERGIPHTVIADNTGGLLMRQGKVDLCLVGTDRTASNGDVANKIGTYLKALAAHHNNVPFYVALPSSSIDWNASSGDDIPIEERDPEEITHISGFDGEVIRRVQLTPGKSAALNLGFDITPAEFVTALITERGICTASEQGIRSLFREGNYCPT